MENFDYNNFDKLNLFVKKQKLQDVINTYSSLGWKLVEKKDNKKYVDIIDITFLRPHNLKNKDDLQLIQVYVEDNLNDIAKLEKYKHSQTPTVGLSLGCLIFLLLFVGINLIVTSQLLILAIFLIIVSIVLTILQIKLLKRLFKDFRHLLSFSEIFLPYIMCSFSFCPLLKKSGKY